MRVLIIGGVAAGMSAASKLNRSKLAPSIKVFENGPDVSYGACGLPYFISGVNLDANRMRIRTVKEFQASGIEVAMGTSVIKVDPEAHTITAREDATGKEYSESYDKLVIATGASPIVPPLPGIHLPGVFTLKTIPDAEAIRKAMLPESVRRVVIVGGGYIGMEMVETCIMLGKEVRVVEMKDQVLPPVDADIAIHAQREAEKFGVVFNLGEAVTGFNGDGWVQEITTNKGSYPADVVILSIGVSPNTKFLAGTGLDMLPNGAIVVDRQMRTNLADIFAAGDCATVWHKLLEKSVYLPLGTNANKQGKALAQVISDNGPGFPGALGTAILKVMEMEIGRTGISEAEAVQNNLEHAVTTVEAADYAPYYPNPTPVYAKLIYHPQTKVIMGAQLAGMKGAAGRLATMTAVVDQRMTTHELNELDLPYAPPFSQVWDVLHVAASASK